MAKWKSGARGGRPDRGGGGFRGGRGRGNNGRGRAGAGWAVQGPGRGRGHSYPASNGSNQDELDVDFTLQTYANAPSPLKPTAEPSVSARGRGIPAYRGRGRGGTFIPRLPADIAFPGKGRGFDIPRRQVQGIGAPKDARRPIPVGAKQTLSSLLLQERPLLKPIMFVPSTETRFLFQNEEELLQPTVESVGDTIQSPIPTADRITRVFSGGNIPPNVWDKDEEDEIEVDFNDFGKLFLPATTNSKPAIPKCKTQVVPVENPTFHEETRPLPAEIMTRKKMADKPLSVQNGIEINGNHLFYVDTQPRNVPSGMEFPTNRQPSSFLPDDDIIVYDAPHPRMTFRMSGPDTESTEGVRDVLTTNEHLPVGGFSSYERHAALPKSIPHSQPKSTISIVGEEQVSSLSQVTDTTPDPTSFGKPTLPDTAETTNAAMETGDTSTSTRLRAPPIMTPRQAKLWKSKFSRANKGTGTHKSPRTPFSTFGTMREEGLLRRLDGERDERYDERRRGDSDIEWGETTDGEDVAGVGKEIVAQEPEPELDTDMKRVLGMLKKGKGLNQANDDIDNGHGMEVDVDFDIATSMRFARGLTGPDAETHVTMYDIECEEIMRIEDDKGVGQVGSTSSEVDENEETVDEEEEEALRIEEAKFIRDGDLGSLDRDDDDEDDLGGSADTDESDEDNYEDNSFRFKLDRLRSMRNTVKGDLDVEDGPLEQNMTWADLDEAFIQDINDILDKEEDLLTSKDQKHKQKLSTSLGGADEDNYEDNSFQFKLDRLRSMRNTVKGDLDDEDGPGLLEQIMSWADLDDEAFINDMLDKEEDLLTTKNQKHKQKLFTSGGAHEDRNWPSRYKNKGIPPELSIQYEIDRQKKAERKRARELERLVRAADPLSSKKGGKKGRKAMLAAAAIDPTIVVIPNRVIDMTTLVQNIRRFMADLGGPSSMSLPPTDKETRKNVHEIAAAFNLKSVSKGKGDARYTTLVKTTKTNIQANEGKVARILRRGGAQGVSKVPRQREGDEVGKAAPKLDESNVGFQLLTLMGWSEGDRIGASTNGLEAPLAAIIKTTKLGLGAKK